MVAAEMDLLLGQHFALDAEPVVVVVAGGGNQFCFLLPLFLFRLGMRRLCFLGGLALSLFLGVLLFHQDAFDPVKEIGDAQAE